MLVCNYTFRNGTSWDEVLQVNTNTLTDEVQGSCEWLDRSANDKCIFIPSTYTMFHPNLDSTGEDLCFGTNDYTVSFDMMCPKDVNPWQGADQQNFLSGLNYGNYEFIFHKTGMWIGTRGYEYTFKHVFSTIDEVPWDGKWHKYRIVKKDNINYWYYDNILQSTRNDTKDYQLVNWGRFFAINSGSAYNLHAYFDNIKIYKNEAIFPELPSRILSNVKID